MGESGRPGCLKGEGLRESHVGVEEIRTVPRTSVGAADTRWVTAGLQEWEGAGEREERAMKHRPSSLLLTKGT